MTNKAGVAAAALLMASSGALATEPGAPATQDQAQQEKKICRTDRATGSLTRRTRICMTRAQWDALHSRTNRGVTEMQNGASGGKECIIDPMGGCR